MIYRIENAGLQPGAMQKPPSIQATTDRGIQQEATGSCERRQSASRSFFAYFAAELSRQAEEDPEPERFTLAWETWQRRHWNRERFRAELREAEAVTRDLSDPAPLPREGLLRFVEWCNRQDTRRTRLRRYAPR
jgi:hypothetical protein